MFDSLVSWESRKCSGVEEDASRHRGKGWRAGGPRNAVERRICQAHKGIIPWGSDESGVNEERSREGGGEAEKRMNASLVATGVAAPVPSTRFCQFCHTGRSVKICAWPGLE